MSLLTVILVLVGAGVLLYFINVYIKVMDQKVKTLLNIVVILFLVIWLLKVFGVWGELSKVRVENNGLEIVPPVNITFENNRIHFTKLGTENEKVLFEIQSTTNVVIDGNWYKMKTAEPRQINVPK